MDPLSISASIAGLIALTTGLIKLTDTLRNSLKEDVLQLVVGVSQDIELLHGILMRIQTWADSVQSNGKGHDQLLNLSPFVANFTDIIKRIRGELLALKEVAKKRGLRRLYSVVSLNERMKALDASRVALSEAKATLLLALSTKDSDISASLDNIQTKLETICLNISSADPSDSTATTSSEFDGPRSFEDWLQSLATEGQEEGELADYRRRRQRKRQGEDNKCSQKVPQAHDKIYVKVVDMKHRSGKKVTETLFLDRSANLIDIILQLHNKGYEDICGFQTEDGNHQYAPFEPSNAPPLIRVTAGPSNYDLSKGLCINENERLVDYFNNFLDYETPKGPNFNPSYFDIQRRSLSQGLEIVDLHDSEVSRTWIDFNRCQRVPADVNMVKQGGFFFPMLQRESLGFKFDSNRGCPDELFAIKLHVGSVNVVTGKPVVPVSNSAAGQNVQDYVVTPAQKRLDGLKHGQGKVQQFVAMPLSWGYGVEEQATGSEFIGGIQLQIAPKLKTDVKFMSQRHRSHEVSYPNNFLRPKRSKISESRGLDIFKSPRELGISRCFMEVLLDNTFQPRCDQNVSNGIRGKLEKEEDQFHVILSFLKSMLRSRFVYELGSHIEGSYGIVPHAPLILHPVEPIVFTVEYDSKFNPEAVYQEISHGFSPFTDFRDAFSVILEKYILPSTQWAQESIFIDGKSLSTILDVCKRRIYVPLREVLPNGGIILIGPADELARKSTLLLTEKFKSKREVISLRERPQPRGRTLGSDGWRMSIGVQGNIRQRIKDTEYPGLWRWDRSQFVNLQIINAMMFYRITGLAYTSCGDLEVPTEFIEEQFHNYPDIVARKNRVHGSGYKTITEIDSSAGINIDIKIPKGGHRIGCACCENNFCDTFYCIAGTMTNIAKELVCDVCGIRAGSTIRFSATMGLPMGTILELRKENGPTRQRINMSPQKLMLPLQSNVTNLSCTDVEFTLVDMLPAYSILSPFLPGKEPGDFPSPGHCLYEVASRPDIIDAIVIEFLGLPLRKRVSLLYQVFKALPSFHPQNWKGRSKLENEGFKLNQNTIRIFLQLVPNASDMIAHGGSYNSLTDVLHPSEENTQWLRLYFEDIYSWVLKTIPSFADIGISTWEFLRFEMTKKSIDIIIDDIVSQKTPTALLNSILLSLRETKCVDYAISRLVGIGADINAQDKNGNTIFHITNIGKETWRFNKDILKLGGRIDIPNNDLDTPLHLAARHFYSITHLEDLCADPLAKTIVNQKNQEGHTPWQIHFATICNSPWTMDAISDGDGRECAAINILLSAGADPTIALPSCDTWVTRATRQGIWDSCQHPESLEGWIDAQLYSDYVDYWNGLDYTEEGIKNRESLWRTRFQRSAPRYIENEISSIFED
ncbi:hypothetical protein AOL_s00173g200 [Orbilia oligospora ATCC 24927]|uniref:Uncharacterized protein n=1 Tax=Arthrobotrys oligospora (strain ATCC 24927 / CBS 115.81 / DSM 1491) TaxID=756982 RepID=G1XP32_ARTOA|nr:hypothetical protein AOL_s00173g200 [Orbilia oligospora ATCC 24927]EGX45099.1 hypothetical protein AOL_s00173g200 [Orbilia oligospora ATCC 24927]